jgi:hypothetical protein
VPIQRRAGAKGWARRAEWEDEDEDEDDEEEDEDEEEEEEEEVEVGGFQRATRFQVRGFAYPIDLSH